MLSEQRAKAALALIEGQKGDYIKACNAKHSEVAVTQLFDWVHGAPFNFKCKPMTLTAAPSDNNYVLFRESFNDWVKAGNKGTPINKYGRLTDDIWGAMFDLYEFNFQEELGEDPAGLRSKLKWVDDGNKALGFGEKHPIDPGEADGTANQTDRRVEALMFEDDEETLPKLDQTNGEDVYEGVTYGKVPVTPMVSAKKCTAYWEVKVDPTTGAAVMASSGESRSMIVSAPGLADGAAVIFAVSQRVGGNASIQTDELK